MEDHPLSEPGLSSRVIDPCVLVIFGATGDLTARKLLPALYNLTREGQLPPQFACVGFAAPQDPRRVPRRGQRRSGQNSRVKPLEEPLWNKFQEHIYYHMSEFHDDAGYESLKKFLSDLDVRLGTKGNRLFYLSTQPSFFPLMCEKLQKFGLLYDS